MPESQTISGIATLLSDKVNLPVSTSELLASYKNADPFPHLVFDNLFRPETLDQLLNELPPMTDEKWVHERQERLVKSNLRSAVDLGPEAYQFASFVHSASFLYLLSEMTGIWGLLPDPYLGGAGYHVVPRGGLFDVHADRNVDQVTGLHRRLAMLTYLNHSWKPEYGGQLELWDTAGTQCQRVVEPDFNRTVIFEVGDKNFHAVRPVTTDERSRMSFAVYYHTVGDKGLQPHNSIYAPTFYQKKESMGRRLLKELTPPILLRKAKSLKSSK
jgi:hypothetical protein